MGTLVENKDTAKKNKKRTIDLTQEEKLSVKQNKKLLKEYNRFRRNMEEIRQAYTSLDNACETDDIYFRLQKLEKVSKRIRNKTAKSHRKILKSMR